MMSLGTCKLVMPLSEFTIASRRPLLVDRLNVGFDRGALIVRQSLDLGVEIAEAVFGIDAQLLRASRHASRKHP